MGKPRTGKKVNCIIDPEVRITGIRWERIMLNVEIESDYDEELSFSLAQIVFPKETFDEDEDHENITQLRGTLLKEFPLVNDSSVKNIYSFRMNMAAMDGNSFLENGRYRFITRRKDSDDIILCTVSYDASYTLCEKDRIFTYGKAKYAYNVWFTTYCGDTVNMVPILNSKFMIANNDWRDNLVVRERVTLEGKLRCILKKFKIWVIQKTYNIIEGHQKKVGLNILFMSETKPAIGGNLKYIEARMKERELDKHFRLSYLFKRTVGRHNGLKSWYDTIKLLAAQDYIFVDDYVPIFGTLDLRRTKLIQVWHAGEGFKAVGYSRFGKKATPSPVHNCHRKYDYVVTGSERLVDVYSEVFGLPRDHFLPLGMARLDGFLDEEKIRKTKESFYKDNPVCINKKLILFSPTFRGTGQKKAYYDYTKLDMDAIYELCGDEYIWAFKMHPFTHGNPPIPDKYKDRMIDLTNAGDINDLYYVTDIMITDYSSTYFEFALLGRPILFYTFDRTVYEVHRGVQKGVLETAPGKVCDTFDELITALRDKDYEIEKTLKFREENFGNYDGHASDRIIDTLLLGK